MLSPWRGAIDILRRIEMNKKTFGVCFYLYLLSII